MYEKIIDNMNPTASDTWRAFHQVMPKRIPHWEHFSNPAAIELMTGLDPWKQPLTATTAFAEMTGLELGLEWPEDDTPVERLNDHETYLDSNQQPRARWNTGLTNHWNWGSDFHSIDDVLTFDPLAKLDLTDTQMIMNYNYALDDQAFFEFFLKRHSPQKNLQLTVDTEMFYNTMFMWPLLTFGWEYFLELAGGYPEETKRLIKDFSYFSRKAFTAIAKLPITSVICHDDLCTSLSSICSPTWLHRFIYPYYEEWFDIIHKGGKSVIFMCDGNIDSIADDVVACGADGLVSEPHTNWKEIIRKHPDKLIAGQGDNRRMMGGKEEIRVMVDQMAATGREIPGYFMCVGNHIPWNIPAENVKYYFDYANEVRTRMS